jgi:hypothetical protein
MASGESGDRSEIDREKKELNTLRLIKSIVQRYGQRLGGAYVSASKTSLYSLAKEAGFKPLEVSPNFSFLDPLGKPTKLSPDNPVRIGKNRMLYVGVEAGRVISMKDLAHDVGVCLMQGAIAPSNQTDSIRISTLLAVANQKGVHNYTTDQLVEAVGEPEEINGEINIKSTLLLDSIILDKTLLPEVIEAA